MKLLQTTGEQVEHKPLRILQVEDNPAYVRLLEVMLEKFDKSSYRLTHVKTLQDALTQLHQKDFDVVLLDLGLPDSDGLATLEKMHDAIPDIPIILTTCSTDMTISQQAVQYGAQDYLVKGEFDADLLMRVILYAIDRKQAESDLTKLAQYDSLTGLANRHLFLDRLEQAILRAQRSKSVLALLYLDLDHFKTINDSLGHDIGDLLLQDVASRIQQCVRAQDTVARLGGDEFTIILENVSDENAVTLIAKKIVDSIAKPLRKKDHEIFTTSSIGIALLSEGQSTDAKALIKQADLAMYSAKQQGRGSWQFFNTGMDKATKQRTTIEKALRTALSREEFELEYQPQIDIQTGRLIGAEALLRWRNPDFQHCGVTEFIPILEQMGLIVPVGEWVLKTACQQWRAWSAAGKISPFSTVSVNFSARQFWQQNLTEMVAKTLSDTGLPAPQLDLELTESLLLKHSEANIQILRTLRDMGVSLTIDDFGTGFSSLTYLKYFPINRLKVDRSFVKDILDNKQDVAIASAIINLAKELNLRVTAEGVDTQEKVNILYEKGCSHFQGNYFSKPLSAQNFPTKFAGINTRGGVTF